MEIENWNGVPIEVYRSKGGVLATKFPYDNLVSTGVFPWPPPEIVQKLYKSKHIVSFDSGPVNDVLGFYSDIQSLHSEDALTWSVFGTISYAEKDKKNRWVADFLGLICKESISIQYSRIFLWRRIPHPETLTSGGPEIDFAIQTDNVLVLGEAKWLSRVGVRQGKRKNKNQIQLRLEFLRKFGKIFYPSVCKFILVMVGLKDDTLGYKSFFEICSSCDLDNTFEYRYISWEEVVSIKSHVLYDEIQRYFEWKKKYSQLNRILR